MSFEERFYAAINGWLNATGKARSDRVTYVDVDKVSAGYGCETCDYDVMIIEIGYIDSDTGRSRLFEYTGGLGELMRELG